MTRTEVERFLRERGCPEDLVTAGLPGLVEEWERFVELVADEYPLGFDDYLNDLDTRQILADAFEQLPGATDPELRRRIEAADRRLRPAIERVDRCLWGDSVADEEGWTPERNWWYFGLPRSRGPLLAEDLEDWE